MELLGSRLNYPPERFTRKSMVKFKLKYGCALLFLLPVLLLARSPVEIIVKAAPEVKFAKTAENWTIPLEAEFQKVLSDAGIRTLKPLFPSALVQKLAFPERYYKIILPDSSERAEILARLNALPAVEFAEVNHVYRIHVTPGDSLYSRQWALRFIHAPQAWEVTRGDPQVVVGVIDTGVDYLHPDLQGQIWVNEKEDLNGNGTLDEADLNGVDDDGNGYVDDVIGWDFTDAPAFPDGGDYLNPDNDPWDEYPGGHGTAVAGIIAAATGNVVGMAGIAPDSRIMILRAGTSSGFLEEDDVAEAILYAIRNGARIINMSFGDVVYSHLLKDAVDFGVKQGVIFVASSGNAGNEVLQYPASYDETISVGAIDSLGHVAGFSSYGSKIDLVAPGKDILSLQPGNKYGWVSGTSFSAPMVSAALALLWASEPGLTPQALTARLLSNCQKPGFYEWNPYYGNGILDLPAILLNYSTHYAHILSPATYQGVHTKEVPVIGTAAGSDFYRYELQVGVGTNPVEFHTLTGGRHRKINDTLFVWNVVDFPDTTYTLQLKVYSRDLETAVHRVVFTLDRTSPVVTEWEMQPLLIGQERGYLLRLQSDDPTRVELWLNASDGQDNPERFLSPYLSRDHTFVLSQANLSGVFSFSFRLENNADLSGEFTPPGSPLLDLETDLPFRHFFETAAEFPGNGYFYGQPVDLNRDGQAEILGYVLLPQLTAPCLAALQIQNGKLEVACAQIPAFPRDVRDLDGDRFPEVLAGYGNKSYLIPGGAGQPLENTPVSIPMDDFWAARLADFGRDGKYEVLAIHENQWGIYRLDDPRTGRVTLLQWLENPTAGENAYGVPFAEIADFDHDGRVEIVFGDYDGDLIFWEEGTDGQFRLKTTWRLPGEDATSRFRAGDFDGDGVTELAVATKHLVEHQSESSLKQQYWILSVLKTDGGEGFREVWRLNVHNVVDQRGVESGVSVGDFDQDGGDELFFTPFPQGYLIQYENDGYQVEGYLKPVNANTVLALAEGQLFVPGDSTLRVLTDQSVALRPAPPLRYRVLGVDTNHIALDWSEVPGRQYYRVERREAASGETVVFRLFRNWLDDSTVAAGKKYRYHIATVDSSLTVPVSVPLETRELCPEPPPELLRLLPFAGNQLRLEFSAPLGERAFQAARYSVEPGHQHPISALRGEGNRQVVLTFQHDWPPGNYVLRLQGLESQQGAPLYPDTAGFAFRVEEMPRAPYVRSVEMLSKKRLKVVFSEAMEAESCQDVANYRLLPPDEILRAWQDEQAPEVVYLELRGKNRLGSLGEDYYLEIGNVTNRAGVPLAALERRFLVYRLVTSLDEVVVFPNPFRAKQGLNEITFGNVPKDCEISIFTASGRRVKTLRVTGNSGGVKWNLRNDLGKAVRNGVYLFLASYRGQQKMGKFVILK